MRQILGLFNLGLIALGIYGLAQDRGSDQLGTLIASAVIVGALGNLYLISNMPQGRDWISLSLRRRALEETKKIEELEKS
jgi:hypothetical protein